MMKCPHCKSDQVFVIDSRHVEDGRRRRYECYDCHGRFTTYESTKAPPPKKVKPKKPKPKKEKPPVDVKAIKRDAKIKAYDEIINMLQRKRGAL